MNGRADIGRGVRHPDHPYKGRCKIARFDALRTQIHPIWKNQIEQQTQRHSRKHHAAQIKIVFPVKQKQGDQRPWNQPKPGRIRKNKPFIKWNQIIQSAVQQIYRLGDKML